MVLPMISDLCRWSFAKEVAVHQGDSISMKRLCVAIFLVTAPALLPVDPAWNGSAFAQGDIAARDAFEAAKGLGTPEAWNAFLTSFPNGFYADLARAYLKKLVEDGSAVPPSPVAVPAAVSTTARAETPRVELGANANLNGGRLLPDDSPWHQDISKTPVDRNSARILARIGDKPLHPDFGSVWEGVPIGIPYVVVPGTQKKVPVTFKDADESDPPVPIPSRPMRRSKAGRTAMATATSSYSIATTGSCTKCSTPFQSAMALGRQTVARSGT